MAKIRIMIRIQYTKDTEQSRWDMICDNLCKFKKICSKLTQSTGTGLGCFYIPLLYVSDFTILDVRR